MGHFQRHLHPQQLGCDFEVRNTDALVLTEASCLTLRYPAAHMRIEPVIPDEE